MGKHLLTIAYLFLGSYKRTLALHAFVPLTALLVFLFLAFCPTWFWPTRWPSPSTFPRSLPAPLPEFILATSFWSLAHLLRTPLWFVSSRVCPGTLDTILFNALYVALSTLLRLAALAALHVRHDMTYPHPTWRDGAFRTVWWVGLGWGFAEAAVSIAQGYQQLACYRTVMVPVERVKEILAQSRAQAQWGIGSGSVNASREYMPLSPRGAESPAADGLGSGADGNGLGNASGARGERGRRPSDPNPNPMSLEEAVRLAVDQDVEQLLHLQEREELEEVYGVPVIVSVLLLAFRICTRCCVPGFRGHRSSSAFFGFGARHWLDLGCCEQCSWPKGRICQCGWSAVLLEIARLSVRWQRVFCLLGAGMRLTIGQGRTPVFSLSSSILVLRSSSVESRD